VLAYPSIHLSSSTLQHLAEQLAVRRREIGTRWRRLPAGRRALLARGLKAYAGASPITRASGKKSSITRRWIKNDRLNHAGYLWAFSAFTTSPGAKAHYRRRRDDHGDWHASAQRNLLNRMLGQLYHCLQHRALFDENTAYPPQFAAA